ncbi:AraC family transcriptional regulator ligand-binding domain-containing protein [Halioxenophilus sp. WMMB6]|uniref:AraC family transcriptional regulator ligand-binding domain-containing protein n=1 Tax=Halioxenophilus sp. WMMB6 TaxID=3073815 RepID=UPI00295F2E5F|nr:AraC family transcriptional regulator ligand-binding domain-containing protein [Halioxenophilus sp. WMMB6]
MKPIVSQDADVLNSLRLATKNLGIELEDAVIKMGLPPDLLKTPDQFVPSLLFNSLFEYLAQDYHCHDLALHAANLLQAPQLGLPARVMSLSRNFKEALDKAAQYGAFYRDTGPWQHQVSDGLVTLFKPANPFGSQHFRQRNLFGTAQMYQLICQLSGNLWRPSRVSFSFPDPGARFTYTFHDFFQCDLAFNQAVDAIHFPEGYLEFNITSADAYLLRGVEMHIEALQQEVMTGNDLLARAKLIINQRLSFASCTLEELASYMATTPESLSQHLAEQGLSFDDLLEQQISEKANYYLTEFHAPAELILSALMPNDEPRLNELLVDKLEGKQQW